MRFFLCIVLAVLFSATMTQAQYYDQALGIRAGTSVEASYKRFIFYTPQIQQAIEGLIGFQVDENVPFFEYDRPIHNGYVFEAMWVFHIDLGFDTNFSGFAGAGFFLGGYVETGQQPIFGGGGTIAVGVEYTFTHVPISIGIDWKPLFGYPRFSLARGGLTLRYILPTTWQ